jgi:hypothetical protein
MVRMGSLAMGRPLVRRGVMPATRQPGDTACLARDTLDVRPPVAQRRQQLLGVSRPAL